MKRVVIAVILGTIWAAPLHTEPAAAEAPEYSKWSRLALSEAKRKYPHADIVDFLHVGAQSSSGVTIERFKLWLKDGNREFGLFVSISFRTETEDVLSIEWKETDR